jgi:hypothetical protein
MGITLYYWPFMGRAAPCLRLLEYTQTPFEWISDKAKMAEVHVLENKSLVVWCQMTAH